MTEKHVHVEDSISVSRTIATAQLEQAIDPVGIVMAIYNALLIDLRLFGAKDYCSFRVREDAGMVVFKMEAPDDSRRTL